MCRIVVSAEVISLDLRDRLGSQLEYDFVMRLQWLSESRSVDDAVAVWHGSPPFLCAPRGPLRGGVAHRTAA